ncbi:MAG: hypothetical protein ACYSSP_13360, partial [Planctomycetota bacterium]
TIGLTLYLGDPRRMFILSLPTRSREPLVPLLNAALQPSDIEEVSVGGQKAIRVISQRIKFLPEIYLVSSSDTLYLCGDRSLVQALYLTPTAQRFGQDPFMSRALPATETKQVRMVLNPAMAKPLVLQQNDDSSTACGPSGTNTTGGKGANRNADAHATGSARPRSIGRLCRVHAHRDHGAID